MALTKYWFSAKQKRMRDALRGDITRVKVDNAWKEYTQSTVGDDVPTVWGDFILLVEGEDLETLSTPANVGDDLSAQVGASAYIL